MDHHHRAQASLVRFPGRCHGSTVRAILDSAPCVIGDFNRLTKVRISGEGVAALEPDGVSDAHRQTFDSGGRVFVSYDRLHEPFHAVPARFLAAETVRPYPKATLRFAQARSDRELSGARHPHPRSRAGIRTVAAGFDLPAVSGARRHYRLKGAGLPFVRLAGGDADVEAFDVLVDYQRRSPNQVHNDDFPAHTAALATSGFWSIGMGGSARQYTTYTFRRAIE